MGTKLHSDIQVYYNSSGAGYGSWDYCATVGDYDLDDPVGYGPTPDAAYWDLIEQLYEILEPDENPGYVRV